MLLKADLQGDSGANNKYDKYKNYFFTVSILFLSALTNGNSDRNFRSGLNPEQRFSTQLSFQ